MMCHEPLLCVISCHLRYRIGSGTDAGSGMKPIILVFICVTGLALGQDKPRVFVQGKGSQNVTTSGSEAGGRYWGSWGSRSSVDSHDEAMEVTKDLQKNCSGVMVTLNQSNTDYTVMLNRESKHNRGLLLTNSQVQVANRLGDVLGAKATRTVVNASKDACRLILADWSQHGRIAVPDSPTPCSSCRSCFACHATISDRDSKDWDSIGSPSPAHDSRRRTHCNCD